MKSRRLTFSSIVLLSALVIAAPAFGGHLMPVKEVPVPAENPQTPEKIELGKKLFFDRRLSGDGTMSCVTCHNPEFAFTDGLPISLSYPTTRNWRNSMTLINVAFNRFLFHDGRSESLEEQALFPIMSSFEMNQNLDYVVEELRSVPEYVAAFKEVFGADVSKERMAMALASFQRTLISLDSPLDRYLDGDAGAMSDEAISGLNIFRGEKGGCSNCHFGPNLMDHKFHATLVPENPELTGDPSVAATRRFVAKVSGYDGFRELKEDLGRYLVTKDMRDWKAFRTLTLRDIAKTAPYMHNGVFQTLEDVIEFYDKGGGDGNRELKPLGLSADEKRYLKAFLSEALSGADIVIEHPEVP